MLDLDATKVLSAWFGNLGLYAYINGLEWQTLVRDLSGVAQLAVAVVTVIYICYKIRNERRK